MNGINYSYCFQLVIFFLNDYYTINNSWHHKNRVDMILLNNAIDALTNPYAPILNDMDNHSTCNLILTYCDIQCNSLHVLFKNIVK